MYWDYRCVEDPTHSFMHARQALSSIPGFINAYRYNSYFYAFHPLKCMQRSRGPINFVIWHGDVESIFILFRKKKNHRACFFQRLLWPQPPGGSGKITEGAKQSELGSFWQLPLWTGLLFEELATDILLAYLKLVFSVATCVLVMGWVWVFLTSEQTYSTVEDELGVGIWTVHYQSVSQIFWKVLVVHRKEGHRLPPSGVKR